MKSKTIFGMADKSSNAEKEIRGDQRSLSESCGDVGLFFSFKLLDL